MTYTDLKPGTAFMLDGQPHVVVSSEFHRMQMRKAVMRAQVRNFLTGQLLQKTFTASDKFDEADVEKANAQYLYRDGDGYCFMDNETYDQYHVSEDVVGNKAMYLTDSLNVVLIMFNNNPIQMEVPAHVLLKVTEAPVAIKGDSVTNTFKTCTCETGLKVTCPIFISQGDVIKIKTETGEYIERTERG
jgi:elongation factor P